MNHANSVFFVGDPKGNFQNRALALADPSVVLEGASPRLLDEWQEVPALWDAVRFEVDKMGVPGQFLLTGSATPQQKGILHSGVGRIGVVRMEAMSLYESGDSAGIASLKDICEGKQKTAVGHDITLKELIHFCARGGWPSTLKLGHDSQNKVAKGYLDAIVNSDISLLIGSEVDRKKLRLLLKSLARNESTVVANTTLQRDINENDGETLHVSTIAHYLAIFERLFLLADQPAYTPNLRSSQRVGKSSKRHFVDPSLAVAALEATEDMLLGDLNTFGFIFESLCIRDLRIYARSFGAEVLHYRDSSGREIDAVIQMPDGSWTAMEIKLGMNQVDAAAKNLVEIRDMLAQNSTGPAPSQLVVLVGVGSHVIARDDGVLVVPLTALRP